MTFSYRRSLAPMLWVFLVLVGIETGVVHLLVALLVSPIAALLLSVASVTLMGWLVSFILSFRGKPVVVEEDRLVMRMGKAQEIVVPMANVAGLRATWDGAALKPRSVLNLATIAYPNILVDLKQPVAFGRRGRMVSAVAHKLDDPQAFTAALQSALAAQQP